MRLFLIITPLLYIILLGTRSYSSAKNLKYNFNQSHGLYRVYKIDSLKNVYIIYTKKDKQLFKILSEKNKHSINKTLSNKKMIPIKTGRLYDFDLYSLFFTDLDSATMLSFPGFSLVNTDGAGGIDYGGTTIYLERDSIKDLHYSNNIVDLYYVHNKRK